MDELFEKFRSVASEVLSVEPDRIVESATFAELDADSLDLVELVRCLEDEYGIEIPDAELDGVDSIGKAYHLLTAHVR
jgi:acyl carrier protein